MLDQNIRVKFFRRNFFRRIFFGVFFFRRKLFSDGCRTDGRRTDGRPSDVRAFARTFKKSSIAEVINYGQPLAPSHPKSQNLKVRLIQKDIVKDIWTLEFMFLGQDKCNLGDDTCVRTHVSWPKTHVSWRKTHASWQKTHVCVLGQDTCMCLGPRHDCLFLIC